MTILLQYNYFMEVDWVKLYPRLFRFAKNNFFDEEAQEDFVQYVAIKILENPKRLNKKFAYFKVDWLRSRYGRSSEMKRPGRWKMKQGDYMSITPIDEHDNQGIDIFHLSSYVYESQEKKFLANLDIENLFEKAMEYLKPIERIIITEHYVNEKTMTEIGGICNLSSNRISQIHRKAIRKLQKKFNLKEQNPFL